MSLERSHHFDPALARTLLDGERAIVEATYALARTTPTGLYRTATFARGLAGLTSRCGRDEEAQASLRLAARAAVGLLSIAAQRDGAVRFPMRDEEVFTLTATGKMDLATPAVWLAGFHAGLTAGDDASLDRLAAIPIATLQDIPGVGLAPRALAYVRCLQAVWTESAAVGPLLADALALTDPEAMHPEQAAWTLHVDVPALALLYRIHERAIPAIDAALSEGLQAHRSYWSGAERGKNPDGILALPLAAMVALARRAGLLVACGSPYLPRVPTPA